ncbi:outer membrane protein assembly factor BamA [Methylomonas sp. EbB]|uniref:Outer membrane protein assembly factor BamA n=1 Tax=Methylomonas fluvii TaxID=1854564 RepID=A0ABR9DCP8_9GAMM|nr:outer membrane protein assembly factor BamA [Methylomonas fluvii]MBD9360853.1 outer membrane protein assembly factor BamA [Methylomonas fluvii]CAD6873725.1 Outer membrane protein assembly factor YaeT [Methylomonas fluvii]
MVDCVKKNPLLQILLLSMLSGKAAHASSFVVEDIQVKGLQRISAGTVYNYLPVNVGETFSEDKQAAAIRALFNTGFFKDISLERDGGTLVVNVVERPSVAKVVIEGNKDIKKEDLTEALKKIGLAEGKVYNKQILDKVEQELRRQYFSHGKYGLKIKTEVSELTRNRVGIHIDISEGRVAKIKQINIVGSKSFANDVLRKEFELSTTNFLSFYSKDDQYSKQKLSADLEKLRSYYLDRGYINFSIESTQVDITADKKEIYITINVKEGDVYTLEKVKLSGELIVQPEELIKLVKVGPGEIFSRKNATETSKSISDRLGDEGYTFANVNMVPEINEQQKTVAMTFFVDPGKRVYVRRINVKGNTKTRDEVIRREARQMESSWAASSKIERTKTRLDRLGYFEEVGVETPPVVGSADQIDVNYTIKEKASGNLQAGVGYSQVQGIIFNANVSQDNIFGTGKRVDFAFNNSSILTRYNLGFSDPYYTLDGVAMGYNLGYTSRNAYAANLAAYNTTITNAGINFGIPLNEFDRIGFDIDLKRTEIENTTLSSDTILKFLGFKKGDDISAIRSKSFDTLSTSAGWTHDTLDRATFAHSGGQQRLSGLITVPGSDLEYFKVGYKHQHYFPLSNDFTFRLLGEVAHGGSYGGSSGLPFFENYFAGGTGDVRGFMQNTLGVIDQNEINTANTYNRPIGGSTKLIGKAELFFPVPFLSDMKSVRIGSFVDAGTLAPGLNSGDLRKYFRYSVGLSGEWLSPFGALAVSVAQPLNSESTDRTQAFQFTFGSGF